jgi:quinol monooxygenase YgiN
MPHVLIIHEVNDYPTWKIIFDDAAAMRKEAGELNYQLLRDGTDANNIVHFSEWISLDKARSFFESPALISIREKAGVKTPNFIYLNEIEHKVL